jgi:GxxExxY protein
VLAYELQAMGKRVERQKAVPLVYESVKLDCGFRADLVVEGRIVVELKCKDALHPVDEAQLLSHLRLLNISVGLLINFHVVLLRNGIRRMVNNYVEPSGISSQSDGFNSSQPLTVQPFFASSLRTLRLKSFRPDARNQPTS